MMLPTISYTYCMNSAMISVTSDITSTYRAILITALCYGWRTPLISVTSDISAPWYHNFHVILALIIVCTAEWRGLRAPPWRARCSNSTGLAIANVLGMGVELNRDCLDDGRLDPAYGLVAVAAALIVSGYRLAVVEKSRLATAVAAGCAGIAPMHRCH